MPFPTDRVILLDQGDNVMGELTANEVLGRVRSEEINGEHTLTLTTTRRLAIGTRVLTRDNTGRWREYVVNEPDESHESGESAIGEYVCPWSVQSDLMQSYSPSLEVEHIEEHAQPGMGADCSSAEAVACALDGQLKWEVGACDVPAVTAGNGAVMIGLCAWDRLSLVVEKWGGEVDADIEMGPDGALTRRVCLLSHVGETDVSRRFDWSRDVTSIHRRPDPGPYFCRVVPLGKGQQEYALDDETTFDWPIGIEEETGGIQWIQDDEAAEAFRVSDGHGGWQYPTKVVEYDEDDPELLLNEAMDDLHNHTRPGVTYEADVLQFAEAGMDVKGVSLGDNVHIVDRGFNPDAALRLEARVVAMEVDELSPTTGTTLTIGQIGTTVTDEIRSLVSSSTDPLTTRLNTISNGGTLVYLKDLIDLINAEVNATGGYFYEVPGVGTRTYDSRVSDPRVGAEARQVVEVSGGTIRIADSRDSEGDWEWRTLFQAGRIASEMVIAANLIAGTIASANGNVYIDLDNGTMRISSATMVGDQSIADALNDAKRYATDYLTYEGGELTLGATNSVIKNVLTNQRMTFRTNSGDVAWFGLNESDIWEMFIDTASVQNRLSFGDFSWIARSNGNMTLKWVGE